MKPPLKHVLWQEKPEPDNMDIREKRLYRAFKKGCKVRDLRGRPPQAVLLEHDEAIKLNTKLGVHCPKTATLMLHETARYNGSYSD